MHNQRECILKTSSFYYHVFFALCIALWLESTASRSLLIKSIKEFGQGIWRPDQLETRCGKESQHPVKGALRPPINQFGDQTSWWEDARLRNMTQRGWPPSPRLSSPGERERNAVMANRVEVNMLQFCSVSNSLSHTTLSNKVRGIFYKRTVSSLGFFMHASGYVAIQH